MDLKEEPFMSYRLMHYALIALIYLSTEYEVQGFPTLKFFKNGVAVEYNGPR